MNSTDVTPHSDEPSAALVEPAASSASHRRLIPWLQLIRLPALFTAMADIFLGFILTHPADRLHRAHQALAENALTFGLLLLASCCLYLAGMVLNDVFDRRQDALERPHRPIPSGRVSLRGASMLAIALVVAGLTAAAALRWLDPLLCGWNPLFVAGLILAAVLLYDAVLKSTLLGPLAMGLCRFLNVLLGASASGAWFGRPFDNPQRWVAIGLGVYIVGVTWFARTEARQSRRGTLIGALLTVNAGIAILFGWLQWGRLADAGAMALLLLAVIALTINKRMLVAVASPTPRAVQSAVRTMLLSVITLDAAMIYAKTGDIVIASVIAAALIVPALLTGRVMRMT